LNLTHYLKKIHYQFIFIRMHIKYICLCICINLHCIILSHICGFADSQVLLIIREIIYLSGQRISSTIRPEMGGIMGISVLHILRDNGTRHLKLDLKWYGIQSEWLREMVVQPNFVERSLFVFLSQPYYLSVCRQSAVCASAWRWGTVFASGDPSSEWRARSTQSLELRAGWRKWAGWACRTFCHSCSAPGSATACTRSRCWCCARRSILKEDSLVKCMDIS